MIHTLAVANYRSLLNLVLPLGSLNVITGPNASGKSNLYRALRLLAETAQGGVVQSLAREGGLRSTYWAGPEKLSRRMRRGEVEVHGGPRQKATRLRLGFAEEDFAYAISLGVPPPSQSAFALDPEIKRECIWSGEVYRPAACLVDREGPMARIRDGRTWSVAAHHLPSFDSLFGQLADPQAAPEIVALRDRIRNWRFYDHFRSDAQAPARQPQLGTRTLVLDHDGRDLAATLQTIQEIGDGQGLDEAVADAFDGARVSIQVGEDGRFTTLFHQQGLLRPLTAAELSDGTLRYLLWVAALMTPRPPPLMVLNEPETSLHPDLLPALARLIIRASGNTQVWVISHATRLVAALEKAQHGHFIHLEKELGQTIVQGQRALDEPRWNWPDQGK